MEINRNVIEAATQHFGVDAGQVLCTQPRDRSGTYQRHCEVVHGDGREWLQREACEQYDIVFVDCYEAQGVVPSQMQEVSFLPLPLPASLYRPCHTGVICAAAATQAWPSHMAPWQHHMLRAHRLKDGGVVVVNVSGEALGLA